MQLLASPDELLLFHDFSSVEQAHDRVYASVLVVVHYESLDSKAGTHAVEFVNVEDDDRLPVLVLVQSADKEPRHSQRSRRSHDQIHDPKAG